MSIIIIDGNEQCLCDCGTKCIKGKSGSAMRCTKEEIESLGYQAKSLEEILKIDYYKLGVSEKKAKALRKTFKRYK